jgi:DNA polymerase-3 subunit gamma/tau
MAYLALARKYRPSTFNEVCGQEITLTILQNSLQQQKLQHAYLFTGSRGVGKTSIARLFAKALNCDIGSSATPCGTCNSCVAIASGNHPDVIEIDAASRTKVEDTREILDNIVYMPVQARFKIYIIDEVHMLSTHSFNALLKTLEEPPEHVKFLLATTDPQKLPVTIISRCLQFTLKNLELNKIVQQLEFILTQEKLIYESDALTRIAISANGSMRDALSLLEQVVAFSRDGTLDKALVYQVLGLTSAEKICELFSAITSNDGAQVLQILTLLNQTGVNAVNLIGQLQSLCHSLTVAQALATPQNNHAAQDLASSRNLALYIDTGFDVATIVQLAAKVPHEQIQRYYQILVQGQRDLPFAVSEALGLQMLILRMLAVRDGVAPQRATAVALEVKQQISTHTTTQENRTSTATQHTTQTTTQPWHTIVPKLNLNGLTKILAMNCNVASWQDDVIHLNLDSTQKPLVTENNKLKLQQALSKLINKDIKIYFNIGSNHDGAVGSDTPLALQSKVKEVANHDIKQALERNPAYQNLVTTFAAKVVDITTS